MAKSKDEAQARLEEEIWSAISAFEQILEAIPNDRASLEALAHAYEQVGDGAKTKDYQLRLATALLEDADADGAVELLVKIKHYAASDPKAAALAAELEKLVSPGGSGVPSQAPVSGGAGDDAAKTGKALPAGVRLEFSLSDEISTAWTLMESGLLTQEQYAGIVQDLTEMCTSEAASTVSVMHVLEHRKFTNISEIVGAISEQCSTPFVSLAAFQVSQEVFKLLPMDFMVRRGCLVFSQLGRDYLVVVMNPYDKQIRKDVETLTGGRCHFYITMPSEFDGTIDALLKASVASGGPA